MDKHLERLDRSLASAGIPQPHTHSRMEKHTLQIN